jgi:hypothetical protein
VAEGACVRVLIFLLNREGAKGAKEEKEEGRRIKVLIAYAFRLTAQYPMPNQ